MKHGNCRAQQLPRGIHGVTNTLFTVRCTCHRCHTPVHHRLPIRRSPSVRAPECARLPPIPPVVGRYSRSSSATATRPQFPPLLLIDNHRAAVASACQLLLPHASPPLDSLLFVIFIIIKAALFISLVVFLVILVIIADLISVGLSTSIADFALGYIIG